MIAGSSKVGNEVIANMRPGMRDILEDTRRLFQERTRALVVALPGEGPELVANHLEGGGTPAKREQAAFRLAVALHEKKARVLGVLAGVVEIAAFKPSDWSES